MRQFDAAHVAAFFDQYGSAEWERHDTSPAGRVSLAVHTDLLAEFGYSAEDIAALREARVLV